jgi:UDP-N-acetylglucosamine 2-epimerase (non-hydrolysing)
MLKVMTIVGTRPELIKMCRVMAELDKHFKHIIVHTGQNYDYELNQIFFEDLEIRKPDFFLGVSGNSAAEVIGDIIAKADKVMAEVVPDALLVYGDTNSCLSVISAKRRKIPVFHFEAGNRCFDQRVPEELNRKVLDHLSDINLVLSEHARRYLIAEGIRPETIIKTGSHLYEVLKYYEPKISKSTVLQQLSLEPQKYFLVSAHREENVDIREQLSNLIESLRAISEKYNFPVIVSTHPRTAKRIEEFGIINKDKNILFSKPFSFSDYIFLQRNALCILSDSGTITEESSILDLPAVTVREMHERPEGMDVGTIIMCGLQKNRIMEAIEIVISQRKTGKRLIPDVADYTNLHVSAQVARIITSYVDYVNKNVWKKNLPTVFE